jgi:hypothetical protein
MVRTLRRKPKDDAPELCIQPRFPQVVPFPIELTLKRDLHAPQEVRGEWMGIIPSAGNSDDAIRHDIREESCHLLLPVTPSTHWPCQKEERVFGIMFTNFGELRYKDLHVCSPL